jgi:hypothetical protein
LNQVLARVEMAGFRVISRSSGNGPKNASVGSKKCSA